MIVLSIFVKTGNNKFQPVFCSLRLYLGSSVIAVILSIITVFYFKSLIFIHFQLLCIEFIRDFYLVTFNARNHNFILDYFGITTTVFFVYFCGLADFRVIFINIYISTCISALISGFYSYLICMSVIF